MRGDRAKLPFSREAFSSGEAATGGRSQEIARTRRSQGTTFGENPEFRIQNPEDRFSYASFCAIFLHCYSGRIAVRPRIFRGRADCSLRRPRADYGGHRRKRRSTSRDLSSSLTPTTLMLLRAPRVAGRFDKLTVPDNGDHLPLIPFDPLIRRSTSVS